VDRDTRERARAADAGPEEQLDLARRHLRSGEPRAALERLEGADLVDVEAWELRTRAELALGRWTEAARAARQARCADPGALPEELLAEVRAGLKEEHDPVEPSPSAAAREAAAEAWARERAWLMSWLGGSAEELRSLTQEHAVVAGHHEWWPEYLDHSDPLLSARARQGLALAQGAAALEHLAPAGDRLHAPQALALAIFPSCAGALRDHAQPLVRHLARGAPPLAAFPREPIPTRLFSAHGKDFQTGSFLSAPVLDASSEARLQLLTPETLDLIDLLCGEAFPWRVRGRGYGLALPSASPRGELQDRVDLLNTLELLPLQLRLGQGHMFDVMSGQKDEGTAGDEDPFEESLARYMAADLCRHPARIEAGPEHALIYARILGAYRPGKEPEEPPRDLLGLASERYSSIGASALEQFCEWGGQPPRRAARRDPYRT
jgi:hypothetical protein